MLLALKKIFLKTKNIVLVVFFTVLTVGIFLSVTQFNTIAGMFSLFEIGEAHLWNSLFNIVGTSLAVMSLSEIIILILLSFFIGGNVVLFLTYLKQYRQRLSLTGSNLTVTAIVLGIFGIGCISCGVLLLAPIISIIGVSAALWVTHYAIALSIVGLLLVSYSNYILLKKISDPQVCKPI